MKEAEELFETKGNALKEQYAQFQKDKEATIAEVKASGLALMQAVQGHAKKAKDEL